MRFASLTRSMYSALSVAALLVSLGASFAHAADDPYVMRCGKYTPSTTSSDYPGKDRIVMSNNLAKPVGKSRSAAGQILNISGRVLDENCVPVIGALIDLWQTDPYGKYHFASEQELLNPYPVFAGSGRATTDNMGNYHFETLFPAPYGKNAPHIHLRIYHPKFQLLDTTIYFSDDRRNTSDPRFQAMTAPKQDALLARTRFDDGSGEVQSEFNIILRGKDSFREF